MYMKMTVIMHIFMSTMDIWAILQAAKKTFDT